MNIVLITNTFTPHVGGVARSVEAFAKAYRERGHKVLIVAPEFADLPENETDVIRVPALQNFNASDFSVALPVPMGLSDIIREFDADIIHSQHPFLLGMSAVRLARSFNLPLVFTHHTLYEQYSHYVPGDSLMMQQYVIELGTLYANMTDQVFSPSESIRDILISRRVEAPIEVVPTGVQVDKFCNGDAKGFRKKLEIPEDAFVVGHMGRLAPEKNLSFLAKAVSHFLKETPQAVFLVVGIGPSEQEIKTLCEEAGVQDRLFMAGVLQSQELADALNAMDVFAFASKSETQGMVLTEAMAAGNPVVALDASGVREVVRDTVNGRLLMEESIPEYVQALRWVYEMDDARKEELIQAARKVADEFSLDATAEKALSFYEALISERRVEWAEDTDSSWEQLTRYIGAEWDIIKSYTQAGDDTINNWLLNNNDTE